LKKRKLIKEKRGYINLMRHRVLFDSILINIEPRLNQYVEQVDNSRKDYEAYLSPSVPIKTLNVAP
jgi:hypothetical protein